MIHLVIVVDVDDDDPILLTFMNELKWRSDSTRIIIYICAVFGTCISSRTNPLDTGWDGMGLGPEIDCVCSLQAGIMTSS